MFLPRPIVLDFAESKTRFRAQSLFFRFVQGFDNKVFVYKPA